MTPIFGIIDHYCIIENYKNREKIRIVFPKKSEKFKKSKSTVQFYWFFLKKCVNEKKSKESKTRLMGW